MLEKDKSDNIQLTEKLNDKNLIGKYKNFKYSIE